MRKLFYMGLEPYEGRYTLQLQDWSTEVFDRRGIDYVVVPGTTIDNTKAISVGQVLDAHGRSYFGMSQMMNLVQMMRNGEVTSKDIVFFEDMFQPGMESLPYILHQVKEKHRPQIYLRCLAQAVDPDDFVHVWGMSKWMSMYEQMCNEIPNVRILATNEEMVAHMRIANWSAPIYNISGLSFGKEEVQGRVDHSKPFIERKQKKQKGRNRKTKIGINQSNKRVHRVFNESFDRGGRIYGGFWQQIGSEHRRHIRLDGQKVAELDFSGWHIALLYTRKNINYFQKYGYYN